ncbi:hypothetical protein FBEOM_6612 [Fusarium beomiforme]|uniref:Uncharacterized protein n=1 Tax=Fusarium beomiforme TaxID=44412 RepID=A0A9P5DW69_9HYPO|nr:hypothetical protein FBEOM_6612 [Fusarium beomiforme]
MSEESNWTVTPAPVRDQFTLADIRDQTDLFLNVVCRTGLVSISLQVYQEEDEKGCRYHFLFELNESIIFCNRDGRRYSIYGVVMWMEPGPYGKGELTVRFAIRQEAFMQPLASFEFPLKNSDKDEKENVILVDLINILQGSAAWLPKEERTNLLRTQWMIRLHNTEMVGWVCTAQAVEDAYFEGDDDVIHVPEFHHIIGAELTSDGFPDSLDMILVKVKRHPVRRGLWLDNKVNRVTMHHDARLPYEGPPDWYTALNEENIEKWLDKVMN